MSDNKQIKSFSDHEIAAFCGQMALILGSGISASEGLEILMEDAASEDEKQVLTVISENLLQNGSFSQALGEAGCFPDYMVSMTAIGEESGRLDQVMSALCSHYEREETIRLSIRNAVTYPMIMIGMMAAVVVVLLTKVLPVFNQVFAQLGSEMTNFSAALLNIGMAMNRYGILLLIILGVIILLVLYGIMTKNGRKVLKNLGNRFAGIRRINEETAAARMAGGLAIALASGLMPERGLELVMGLMDDDQTKAKLASCKQTAEDGGDMVAALHDQGLLTGTCARLAVIGQRTGTLDQSMAHIADLYQESIDTRMNNLLAVLEPTLVVILSVIVGVILLSVMLPLLGIMSGI